MATVNSGRALLAAMALAGVLGSGCRDEDPPRLPDAAAMSARDGGADAGRDTAGSASGSDVAAAAPEAGPAAVPLDCFKGKPTTHDELINACWDDTVTVILSKPVMLPEGYTIGAPLPPIP